MKQKKRENDCTHLVIGLDQTEKFFSAGSQGREIFTVCHNLQRFFPAQILVTGVQRVGENISTLASERRRISGCRFSPPGPGLSVRNNNRKYVCVHRLFPPVWKRFISLPSTRGMIICASFSFKNRMILKHWTFLKYDPHKKFRQI